MSSIGTLAKLIYGSASKGSFSSLQNCENRLNFPKGKDSDGALAAL